VVSNADLKSFNFRELSDVARKKGIPGWRSMRKAELIAAIAKVGSSKKRNSSPRTNGSSEKRSKKAAVGPGRDSRAGASSTGRRLSAAQRRIRKSQARHRERQDISTVPNSAECLDRIVLLVRDAYWLQACWELSGSTVERARAALSEEWHAAQPVIRLFSVESSVSSQTESMEQDAVIHGGARTWFLEVSSPPQSFRAEIGYRTSTGRFLTMARSNLVTTPRSGTMDALAAGKQDISENFDQIYSLCGGYNPSVDSSEIRDWIESRLNRSLGSPMRTQFGAGAEGSFASRSRLVLSVEAEMVVYGRAIPGAHVTLSGEPVTLLSDGSFAARVPLPERRQVVPVVATARDGCAEQTIVLAVERNTKKMELRLREPGQ
jgi:hypothetical protein